ncbi:anti-sigma-D factor RsdA [Prescottella subtropica]|uniref:anti-sigma-D factor RsdA n=1 Tax=Prescottella subtropica TaxID=2545757 RepID=UPI0010F77C1B|nr:anti-sigma-D factor RsdA [Prescottella subtropica]
MARGHEGHGGEPGDPHADLAGNNDPVDVSAVRRDDALIDAIACGDPVATEHPDEYQVAALLANWRAEIVAQPMPAEPDLDDIVERVNRELAARELEGQRSLSTRLRSGRGGLRLLRPIAAAAAVVAIAMGGMTVFSYNAQPGDPLWGVTQVVFTQRAASTVAKIDTTSNLEEAERLIATGDTAAARARLESAATRASAVNDAGARDELNGWRQRLLTQLQTTPPPVAPPPATAPSTVGEPSGTPSPVPSTPSPSIPSGTPNPELPLTSPPTSPAESSTPDPGTSTPGPSEPSTSAPTSTSTSAATSTTTAATSTTKATSGGVTGGGVTGGGGGAGSLDPSTR